MKSPEKRTASATPVDPELAEIRRQHAAGVELTRADLADPVRGSVWNKVQAIRTALAEEGNATAQDEITDIGKAFAEHFGEATAKKYRLYHAISGSSPYEGVDLFDAEGEWSIETAMNVIAQKYKVALH